MIDPDDDSGRSVPNVGDERRKTLNPLSYRTPIEYAPLPPRSTHVVPIALIIIGAVVFVLGIAFIIFALNALNQTQTPGYSLGPNAYVFDILQGFVLFAVIDLCFGATLCLLGRNLYERRGVNRNIQNRD